MRRRRTAATTSSSTSTFLRRYETFALVRLAREWDRLAPSRAARSTSPRARRASSPTSSGSLSEAAGSCTPPRRTRCARCSPRPSTDLRHARAGPRAIGFARRMRFFEYESRQIVQQAGIPVSAHGFAATAAEARADRGARSAAPTVIKSQVLTGGRMKAGGVRFADTPDGGRGARRGDPRARDRRPHAARRAGRLARGRGQAGVLRRRDVGRHAQAAGADLLRHGRDRHRGGRRDAPRPRRARRTSRRCGRSRLRGQAGDRLGRRDRPGADPARPRSSRGWRGCSASTT